MSPHPSFTHSLADAHTHSLSPVPFCSPQSIVQPPTSILLDMKDISTANRHSRISTVYPKKRPSPHGVSKSHKTPLFPANGAARKSPRSAKSGLIQQRQREAQILALRREGVLLEEEYREEIEYYMHDMEVSATSDHISITTPCLILGPLLSSGSQCLQLSLWTNNLKFVGT